MSTVSDIAVNTITGTSKTLGDYAGNVLLIVNVASYCGYTPQYEGLEELNQKYKDQGLRVLGFPCNDFGAQEPGSNEEIQQFCSTRYGASFEMFDKVHAKGADQHPLYATLTQSSNPPGDVAWNFEKFLISKTGEVVGRFPSRVAPNSPELISAIEAELAK
ncbi:MULTISPECIES: glutathione peroxidase [unclassified Leptolyngbya]|uniref:glutathione peroxidase n=1 Tax=unclassified Leptolyngbya TaxID=2650499 RepID=UPI0016844AB5|nr:MULTISPECIES: glutathione peroxidase [unclassified Leptolyngbya]MBD1910303.1 glutathione peroxidase [Leptolyngbya sp. FACHB-8]MBD2155785.1 glutathione peroxidase [Leptolyngbya sp. FACHB-16]